MPIRGGGTVTSRSATPPLLPLPPMPLALPRSEGAAPPLPYAAASAAAAAAAEAVFAVLGVAPAVAAAGGDEDGREASPAASSRGHHGAAGQAAASEDAAGQQGSSSRSSQQDHAGVAVARGKAAWGSRGDGDVEERGQHTAAQLQHCLVDAAAGVESNRAGGAATGEAARFAATERLRRNSGTGSGGGAPGSDPGPAAAAAMLETGLEETGPRGLPVLRRYSSGGGGMPHWGPGAGLEGMMSFEAGEGQFGGGREESVRQPQVRHGPRGSYATAGTQEVAGPWAGRRGGSRGATSVVAAGAPGGVGGAGSGSDGGGGGRGASPAASDLTAAATAAAAAALAALMPRASHPPTDTASAAAGPATDAATGGAGAPPPDALAKALAAATVAALAAAGIGVVGPPPSAQASHAAGGAAEGMAGQGAFDAAVADAVLQEVQRQLQTGPDGGSSGEGTVADSAAAGAGAVAEAAAPLGGGGQVQENGGSRNGTGGGRGSKRLRQEVEMGPGPERAFGTLGGQPGQLQQQEAQQQQEQQQQRNQPGQQQQGPPGAGAGNDGGRSGKRPRLEWEAWQQQQKQHQQPSKPKEQHFAEARLAAAGGARLPRQASGEPPSLPSSPSPPVKRRAPMVLPPLDVVKLGSGGAGERGGDLGQALIISMGAVGPSGASGVRSSTGHGGSGEGAGLGVAPLFLTRQLQQAGHLRRREQLAGPDVGEDPGRSSPPGGQGTDRDAYGGMQEEERGFGAGGADGRRQGGVNGVGEGRGYGGSREGNGGSRDGHGNDGTRYGRGGRSGGQGGWEGGGGAGRGEAAGEDRRGPGGRERE